MKLKTAELAGSALDWAVAKCEGFPECREYRVPSYGPYDSVDLVSNCNYSEEWSQAGPIIERECIDIEAHNAATSQPRNPEYWSACLYGVGEYFECFGRPTPLIAAMRCYVASKLGSEVEVPDGLA